MPENLYAMANWVGPASNVKRSIFLLKCFFFLASFSDDNEELQPHEKRFKARLKTYEDYLRKLDVEDIWPIHGTHCTIPKIHKPTKEEFTEKCMKPGMLEISISKVQHTVIQSELAAKPCNWCQEREKQRSADLKLLQ